MKRTIKDKSGFKSFIFPPTCILPQPTVITGSFDVNMRQLCATNQSEYIDPNAIITQSILRISDWQIIKTEHPDAPQQARMNSKKYGVVSTLLGLLYATERCYATNPGGAECILHKPCRGAR